MAKLSKKMAIAVKKVDSNKLYDLTEAMKLVKEVNVTKFDSSVDLHIRLGWTQGKPIRLSVER